MTKTRFVLLIDFSPYSEAQLRLAQAWGGILDAELLLVHRVSDAVPVMADMETKIQIVDERKKDGVAELKRYAADTLTDPLAVRFHVTERNLLEELPLLLRGHQQDVVFVGLKGSNLLKKYLLGSTATAVIDHLQHIVVAVPNQVFSQHIDVLHIAVSPKYPLDVGAFDNFLARFSSAVQRLHFVSVLADNDAHTDALAYLQELARHYAPLKPTVFDIFEGNDAFSSLKTYMREHPDGVLVVQRGSRTLHDEVFRKYLIGELVDHGHIPLVVLP